MKSRPNQPINQLDKLLQGYEPSERVCLEIGRKSIVMFSGPFAIGKTSLMKSVESVDDNCSRTRGFTTRPCRDPSEQENYRFVPHTEENIQMIIEKATEKELVQGMVHPTTRFVYGSELLDYGDGSVALLDIVPKAVEPIMRLPFKSSRIIEVVASPDVWYSRVASRGGQHSETDRHARIKEAKINLEWALGRDDVIWIDNSGDMEDVTDVALEVIGGRTVSSSKARSLGEKLLKQISTLHVE